MVLATLSRNVKTTSMCQKFPKDHFWAPNFSESIVSVARGTNWWNRWVIQATKVQSVNTDGQAGRHGYHFHSLRGDLARDRTHNLPVSGVSTWVSSGFPPPARFSVLLLIVLVTCPPPVSTSRLCLSPGFLQSRAGWRGNDSTFLRGTCCLVIGGVNNFQSPFHEHLACV